MLPQQFTILVKGNIQKLRSNADAFGYTFNYNAGDIASVTLGLDALTKLIENKIIVRAEFVEANKQVLNDTMVVRNRILPVKNGAPPLPMPFDGTGVVIGIIDTGTDWRHADFKDINGQTRIQYIWDQNVGGGAPAGFNYGKEWTAAQINANICTHDDVNGSSHGTHVSGVAAGNGLATGKLQGCAPKADLIIVAANFNLPQPTIADAVQYIYSKAQSMGKPCVINASLGSYYGSHDGTDLEAQMIKNQVQNMQGRVMVAAAGNAGLARFHTLTQPPPNDTVFTWVQAGNPISYWCYGDTNQVKNLQITIGANRANYSNLGTIGFKPYNYALNTPKYDTLKHNGNRIGVVYTSASINTFGVYELFVSITADTANLLWRAETMGSGLHHSWNFSFVGTGLPTVGQYPRMAKYVTPDTLYSLVTSFQCLDDIITVANYCNLANYYDYNNNLQPAPKPYDRVDDSSIGPTRDGRQKPDIAATGQAVFAALAVNLQANYITNIPQFLAPGGKHVYGTGTSAASPVVAGFAALYLQAYPYATSMEVKNRIINCAYSDAYTGVNLPNYAWGHGKLDGFAAMNCVIAGENGILKDAGQIKYYPNPFTDRVNIKFKDQITGKISVYTSEGKLIMQDKVAGDSYELQLPGSNYSGLLIVRVESPSGNASFKLARNR
jgi:subtilisin family serine protease